MACVAVSCQNVRKATAETLVESVKDPKSGSQVFTRSYDTEPWHQCRGIQKERKSLKKKRVKDTLMDIDFSLNR